MGDNTSVTVGVFAGAFMAIFWFFFKHFSGMEIPAEIVAASVTVVTGITQFVVRHENS